MSDTVPDPVTATLQHSWANRRVRALREGKTPEPMPEPAQPWDDHPKCFREALDGLRFCNTCSVSLVKDPAEDDAAKLAGAEAALQALTPRQLVTLLTRMGGPESIDPPTDG